MRLYIEYNNQRIPFPVNPESLRQVRNAGNQTFDVVSLGQINQLGFTTLTDFTIESFFPARSHQSFILTQRNFRRPNFYVDLIERIKRDRRPCRIVLTNTRLSMLVSIESFDYEFRGADGDIYFKLDLKEFKQHSAREVSMNLANQIPRVPVVTPRRPTPPARITVGSIVIVNGRLHQDSFGSGPGQTERNATRRVSHHVPGRRFPLHVKTLDGGWRGWVTAGSVRLR